MAPDWWTGFRPGPWQHPDAGDLLRVHVERVLVEDGAVRELAGVQGADLGLAVHGERGVPGVQGQCPRSTGCRSRTAGPGRSRGSPPSGCWSRRRPITSRLRWPAGRNGVPAGRCEQPVHLVVRHEPVHALAEQALGAGLGGSTGLLRGPSQTQSSMLPGVVTAASAGTPGSPGGRDLTAPGVNHKDPWPPLLGMLSVMPGSSPVQRMAGGRDRSCRVVTP